MENTEVVTKKLGKQELLDIFKKILSDSELDILESNFERENFFVKISDNARKFELHFILKNISNGGWKDKTSIKRIQIGNIKETLVTTNRVRTHMLCGLATCLDRSILVVWNSYLYTNHQTNRSCYISEEAIQKCYKKGYIFVHEFDQDIWLCDERHFGLLIRDYINYNYME